MRRASVLVAALVCVAATARAEPVDLTKRGLELRREHRDAEALEEFRRAYAVRPAARTLAQIALAEQALGLWVDAEADLQKALEARDDPWIQRNVTLLDGGLSSIQGHLGWLEIASDVARAELAINGVPLGERPLPARLRIVAGSVEIELRAHGYAPARRVTSVEARGSARETVPLVPLAPPSPTLVTPVPPPPASSTVEPPVAPARRVPQDRALRNVGFVALGAAALGVGLGSYFGVRTLSTKSQRDHDCTGTGGSCTALGVDYDGEARALALRSTAWFVSGALAVGAGVVLLWVSRSTSRPAASVGLELAPMLGADRAGATLGGAW